MNFIVKTRNLNIRKIKFVNHYYSLNLRFLDVMFNIYGINRAMGHQICRLFGLSANIKFGNIDSQSLYKISDFFISYILIERGLRRYRNGLLFDRKNNGCVRGLRLLLGLPINGQRTHTNAKSVRKIFKSYKFED